MISRKQFPQFLAPYCIAFERSAGAVVFCVDKNDLRYLLIKYRNGHWEFPRGKMENGESEIQTVRREIMEETGITQITLLPASRMTMRFTYHAHGHERAERIHDGACIYVHKKAIFYIAQTHKPHVTLSHEHQDFRWLSYDHAMDQLTYDNAKRILRCAHRSVSAKIVQK
jgi:8-oxo-dGTP pyrophosphatase MutT (NUDIX family)